MKVAVSGAMGRLGIVIAKRISQAGDMELCGLYDPPHAGNILEGLEVLGSIENIKADIIVECAHPGVVLENIRAWHGKGMRLVVGTSGFTEERVNEVRSFWTNDDPGCLIVPNFSIGAVLMMRFAEMASAYFDSAEIIERHENTKPEAPSGTALATALRMGKYRNDPVEIPDMEMAKGARGGWVSGVRVHSLRMAGLLSDQEVAFSNLGETFSIRHNSSSYESFGTGALTAIRYVEKINGVDIGLDKALEYFKSQNH